MTLGTNKGGALGELIMTAWQAAFDDEGPPHPTLEHRPFGEMTEAELREVIAWCARAKSHPSSSSTIDPTSKQAQS